MATYSKKKKTFRAGLLFAGVALAFGAFFAAPGGAQYIPGVGIQSSQLPLASPAPGSIVLGITPGAGLGIEGTTSKFTVGSLSGPIAQLITPSMLATPGTTLAGTFPGTTATTYTFPGPLYALTFYGSAAGLTGITPCYTLSGAACASTFHVVRVTGTTSSSISTCGPLTYAYCTTITLPVSQPFSSVTTSATSFDVGGSSVQVGGYWEYAVGDLTVDWNSVTTLYVATTTSSQAFSFIAEGF